MNNGVNKQPQQILLEQVESLLADPANASNPMRDALQSLHRSYLSQQERLDRLLVISDTCQRMLQDEKLVIRGRADRSRQRHEKMSRIADRYQQLMLEQNQQLSQEAGRDSLTGLPNRRMIDERLDLEARGARRHGQTFTLAMVDIDHFKQVNDEFGHEVGDRILVATAQLMQDQMREYDLCGRWGGEEFLILLADTRLESGKVILERLRQAIEAMQITVQDNTLGITVSAGLAEHAASDSPGRTVDRADKALYQAKRSGRNQCRGAPSHPSHPGPSNPTA